MPNSISESIAELLIFIKNFLFFTPNFEEKKSDFLIFFHKSIIDFFLCLNLLPAITTSLQNNNLFEFFVSDYLDRRYRLGQSHAFFLGVHFGHIKHYLNIVK